MNTPAGCLDSLYFLQIEIGGPWHTGFIERGKSGNGWILCQGSGYLTGIYARMQRVMACQLERPAWPVDHCLPCLQAMGPEQDLPGGNKVALLMRLMGEAYSPNDHLILLPLEATSRIALDETMNYSGPRYRIICIAPHNGTCVIVVSPLAIYPSPPTVVEENPFVLDDLCHHNYKAGAEAIQAVLDDLWDKSFLWRKLVTAAQPERAAVLNALLYGKEPL